MGLFRRKLKPDPLIRWYGKLPAYADYYDSGRSEEWTTEFTQKWLMNGFQIYENQRRGAAAGDPAEGRSARRMPTSGCILQLPQSGMTVLSCCLDFGGDTVGRKFPLCLYVGLPAADWPRLTGGSVLPALAVLSYLSGFGRRVARFLNEPGVKGPEQFRAQFADQEVNLDHLISPTADAWMDRAKAIRMADWYAAAGDVLGATGLDAWLCRAETWGDRLARSDSAGFKATLSLPLVPERAPGLPRIDRDIQVAGWLRWLEGRIDLKKRPVSLITPEEPLATCSRLTVIIGELAPDDYLLATPLASGLKHVDDLTAVREELPAETSAQPDAIPSGSTPATWDEFVSARAKVELKV